VTMDGLDPPGVQLALFPVTMPAVVESVVHRARWGPDGWSCACGAGRIWPDRSIPRAKQAAATHIRAARKRAAKSPDRP